MNNTKISPKFRNEWSVQPLSHVYWLVLWGLPSVRVVQILNGLVSQRSHDSLMSITQKVKSWITSGMKPVKSVGVTASLAKRLEKASKIPVRDELLKYKAEGVGFKPVTRTGKHQSTVSTKASTTKSLPEPENPFANQSIKGGQVRVIGRTESMPWQEPHMVHGEYPRTPVEAIPKPTATDPNSEVKELMALAKSMGATEIEYKGMKIKF